MREEGDLDGSFGYWAEDEEDGAEGIPGCLRRCILDLG